MQIHPLVPMKKAASLLGVDKRLLKQRLEEGIIKGEKRRVGSKDKWFIYSSEFEGMIDADLLPELERISQTTEERISVDDLEPFFDQNPEELTSQIISFDPEVHEALDDQSGHKSVPATISVEYFIDALTREFTMRLSHEHQTQVDLKEQLKQKEAELASIPELQRELENTRETISDKNTVINELKAKISELEANTAVKNRTWWQRLFG